MALMTILATPMASGRPAVTTSKLAPSWNWNSSGPGILSEATVVANDFPRRVNRLFLNSLEFGVVHRGISLAGKVRGEIEDLDLWGCGLRACVRKPLARLNGKKRRRGGSGRQLGGLPGEFASAGDAQGFQLLAHRGGVKFQVGRIATSQVRAPWRYWLQDASRAGVSQCCQERPCELDLWSSGKQHNRPSSISRSYSIPRMEAELTASFLGCGASLVCAWAGPGDRARAAAKARAVRARRNIMCVFIEGLA